MAFFLILGVYQRILSLDIQFSIIDLTETWLKDEISELYELLKFILEDPPKKERCVYTFTKMTIT